MDKTFEDLHRYFCELPSGTIETKRIQENHKKLIQSLNRKKRRRVLRIIDDKDMLIEQASLEGFTAGLRLGIAITFSTQSDEEY